MNHLWHILIVVTLSVLAAPMSFWFDRKITPNPYLRMQANFDCVFGLFFAAIALPGVLGYPAGDPVLLFDSYAATAVLFVYSMNCLLLSLPAMLGRQTASKILFYLAWPRLLLPCVGWFFSFFSIRYYLMGMKQLRGGKVPTGPQPPRDRW